MWGTSKITDMLLNSSKILSFVSASRSSTDPTPTPRQTSGHNLPQCLHTQSQPQPVSGSCFQLTSTSHATK